MGDTRDRARRPIQAWSTVVWIILILGIAAYGAAVVRNVTETLTGIAFRSATVDAARPPSRYTGFRSPWLTDPALTYCLIA